MRDGNSHAWHEKYSLHHSKIFGRLACRVCSKILGIGSAERSWGDVKHLKSNKRSHLSGERVKKQATIFGSSTMLRADMKRISMAADSVRPYKFWMEEDFDREFDLLDDKNLGNVKSPRAVRIFKAWKEDWEQAAILKRDPVSEARILEKYGGLQWFDPDKSLMCTAGKDELVWTRKWGIKGGYCVQVFNENYDEDAADNETNIEPWEISKDLLIDCIAEYYTEHKHLGVTVLQLEPSEDNSQSNDSESH